MSPEASPQNPRSETAGRRSGAIAVLVILTGLIAGLGLAEGVVRLASPALAPSHRVEFTHPEGPLLLARPDTQARQISEGGDFDVSVRINSHGLRDPNDVATAGADDIVVVGDAFAWGWGVESQDRFSDRLQILSGRRTFNLATPTDIEGYAALLAYAARLGSRAGRVVVTVDMEKDLRPPARGAASQGGDSAVAGWLTEHSALYRLASSAFERMFAASAASGKQDVVPNDYDPAIIDRAADELEKIADRYRATVVLIPSRALWMGEGRSLEDRVNTAFTVALQRRDIDVLDLQPVLEAQGSPLSYYFAHDGHWTAGGHALVAHAISQHLAR
jgi:hypothetical protein